MKFNPSTGITWSLLELAGLLEDEDSHVHFGKIKKHLGLHPFHLTNLNVALNEILRSSLNSYDTELQGFLLAYKNPKLLTALGNTFYDSCFIHVDIEADFYIFRPKVGHEVKGIVNKKGYNHIGVLVHKAFNVSIPKTPNSGDWPGDLIEIGQEVKFTITHIDLTSRLPFIRGSINRANYLEGCKLPIKKTKRRKKTTTSNESFYDRDNDSDNNCDSNVEEHQALSQSKKLEKLETQVSQEKYSKKKRRLDDGDAEDMENKKHSKKRLKLSQELNHSEYEVGNNISYDSSSDTTSKKKKKREKNSKRKSVDLELDYSSVKIKVEKDVTSNSDSEAQLKKREKKSKRESKKLKHSDSTNCSVVDEELQKDIKLENKRHSKKHKSPNADVNDSRIEIKVEGSPNSNNTTEFTLDQNNHDIVSHRRKPFEKHIKKSITDSEFEIANVQIKEEKHASESEHTQEDSDTKDKIPKIIKTEKFEIKSNCSRTNTESETYSNETPTKRKRRREKTPVVQESFENVKIKEEKLGDDFIDYTPKSQKSSINKYINNVDNEENHESDTQQKSSRKKSKKITAVIEENFENVSIKEEKLDDDSIDYTRKIKKSSKNKYVDNVDNDENHESDTQYKSSKNKSPKKSKKITAVIEENFENVSIKEEKLNDDSIDYTRKIKKSSKNKYVDNVSNDENHESDTKHKSSRNKSPKKSKEIASYSQEVRIKVEEEKIKSEKEDNGSSRETSYIEKRRHKISPKKHSKNESFKDYQSDNSTIEGFEETKHNILSPRKPSKKSKEPQYEILSRNAEIKIESSSSIES